MKIRNGFVSNSSSSSFCIYGVSLDEDDIMKRFDNIEELDDNEVIALAKQKLLDDNEEFEMYEFIEYIESNYGLCCWYDSDNSCLYVGRDFSTIKDDETGKEFKENAMKEIKKIFGKELEGSFIEEVIYG